MKQLFNSIQLVERVPFCKYRLYDNVLYKIYTPNIKQLSLQTQCYRCYKKNIIVAKEGDKYYCEKCWDENIKNNKQKSAEKKTYDSRKFTPAQIQIKKEKQYLFKHQHKINEWRDLSNIKKEPDEEVKHKKYSKENKPINEELLLKYYKLEHKNDVKKYGLTLHDKIFSHKYNTLSFINKNNKIYLSAKYTNNDTVTIDYIRRLIRNILPNIKLSSTVSITSLISNIHIPNQRIKFYIIQELITAPFIINEYESIASNNNNKDEDKKLKLIYNYNNCKIEFTLLSRKRRFIKKNSKRG